MSQVRNGKKIFADRMRAALAARGVKISTVAREYGVSQPAVSAWLAGRREPGFDFLAFLKERYGINPAYIIAGEGPPLLPRDDKTLISTIDHKKKLRKKKNCSGSATATS